MAEQRSNSTTKSNLRSYLWLAIGAVLLVFANGRWIIPLAAWLTPVFMMRFLRMQKPTRGLILVALTCIVINIIAWQGMIPVPGIVYHVITAGISLTYLLPFLADRFIAPRVHGFASTLVFPLAWTTMEYLNSLANPYSTWCALAYTQYGYLSLVQVVSVTGLSGLAFLISWFASVVNWVWEQHFQWPKVRMGIGLYTSILALVLFFGGARLALFPPASNTVRVGSITIPHTLVSQFRECVKEADWDCVRQTSSEILGNLIEHSRKAARAGAKIVFWQEYACRMLKPDETASIERGRELARLENVYLGMALLTITRNFPGELAENKVIWIAPSGDILVEYLKSRPVPGEPVIAGDGNVVILDTPFGKIASVICFDMDFPGLVRQAGHAGADLMLVPANDWKEVKLLHSQMALFRAIENGFSLVRSNGQGISTAADYQGRIRAAIDDYTTKERLMIADVPVQGVTTIYSRIDDLFAWLCVAGFLAVIGWAVVRRRAA
jgi:apolipoprotein N-acyltransferase